MKREDFSRFDAKMYKAAEKMFEAKGECDAVRCFNCPACFINRIDNTTQCWINLSFKDQVGDSHLQRKIKYFKEFIELYDKDELYDKENKEEK
jgi:hypothetical protein